LPLRTGSRAEPWRTRPEAGAVEEAGDRRGRGAVGEHRRRIAEKEKASTQISPATLASRTTPQHRE
jgi:hypothetical protein